MFESFENRKTEKAKCPQRREEKKKKNSTLPKTMPQAAGKNSRFRQNQKLTLPKIRTICKAVLNIWENIKMKL